MLPPFHVPGLRGLAAHLHHNRTEARILIMTSEERREARYHRRKAARENRRRRRSEALGGADQVYSFRKMFKWGKKCCNNVRWKQSTQNFERHLFSGTARRRREVLSGKWRPKPGAHFTLRERGKVRPIDAPHINDRQIHKTHTKEVLEPLYTPGMIYYNGASQRGKGLQFHYKGLKKALRKTYRESGRSGYIILVDLKQFFPSAPHAAIYERHRRLIYDPRIRAVADTVVASVPGGVGMPLGVEPSQMEMVSMPSSVDNWIACQLRAKNPAHYMDDYHMGAETKEQAEKFLQATAQRMEDMGLTVNRNKSKIVPLTKPFRFCKAKFHLTETGRIITHGCRDGMKRARRKLRFFQGEVAAGRKTVEEVARWLNDGPIAYYEQFNDHGRVLKLRRVFYAMFIKDRNTEEVKPCIGS